MKSVYISRVFAVILFSMLFVACSPRINYLGDIYAPTEWVDVYYDEGDIKRPFRVIGQLNSDNVNNVFVNMEKIRKKMIDEAKKRGAQGIWFLGAESGLEEQHFVYSKLIRYED